jgi:RNA polymerase sigma factor (sigma-70 family)
MVRSEQEVERLVRENQKLVHFQVNRYLQRRFVGAMEREDLVSWGLIGLVQAARLWDPERAAFATLACRAIEWSILRGVRQEWKPEQATVTRSLDELMSTDDTDGREERFVDQVASEQDVEGELLTGVTRAAIRSAVQELRPSERRLIEQRFYEDVPLATLAREMGVSLQTVYFRQQVALRRLRGALSGAVTAGAL